MIKIKTAIYSALLIASASMTGSALAFVHSETNNTDINIEWRDEYRDPLVMPKVIKTSGEKIFIFSPRARQWGAYGPDGTLVGYGRANGGNSYCAELNEPCFTPTGKYRVYRKGSEDCKSNQFPIETGGGAAMPYCMFFEAGNAIHGSPVLSFHNSSHGCIRVTTLSADWLSHNFVDVGTRVVVLNY